MRLSHIIIVLLSTLVENYKNEQYNENEFDNFIIKSRMNGLLKKLTKREINRENFVDEPANRCAVKFIIDTTLFTSHFNNRFVLAKKFVMKLINKVNYIFTNINFDDGHKFTNRGRFFNMGFTIGGIDFNSTQFNTRNKSCDNILEDLAFYKDCNKYCLVNLITAVDFGNEKSLGCSYNDAVCYKNDNLSNRSLNVVVTNLNDPEKTTLDAQNERLFLRTTAHEYGHTWGAVHDRVDIEGDGFIMSPKFMSSSFNFVFSKTSINDMRRTLKKVFAKEDRELCFAPESNSFCGNRVIEDGEECDNGFSENDCCTNDCKLSKNSVCSPINHSCCTEDCQIQVSPDVICMSGNPMNCVQDAYCDGKSFECAEPRSLDGSICYGNGTCRKGVCVSSN